MKKIIFLSTLILTMALLLTACGGAGKISDSAASWSQNMTRAGFRGEIEENSAVTADFVRQLLSSSSLSQSERQTLQKAFAGGWHVYTDRGAEITCLKMDSEKNAAKLYDLFRAFLRGEAMREYESGKAGSCSYSRLEDIFEYGSCLLIHSDKAVYSVYSDYADEKDLRDMDALLASVGFSLQKNK